MRRVIVLFTALCLCLTGSALAANSVVVASKTVEPGDAGITIPIKLTNDITVRSVVVPLVIREITPGAFPTSLSLSYDDRLPETPGSPLVDLVLKNQYPDEDGSCKSGQPGGLGAPSAVDYISPDGVMFLRARTTGASLGPGADVTGSMVITMDVSTTAGTFEIDTTCTNIANHLYFTFGVLGGEGYVPSFTKGTVTIAAPAANSVAVESKTVTPGETGVQIPIRLTNDFVARSVTVPLVLREITPGSFITALSMSYGDRLPDVLGAPLSDIVIKNEYSTEDGTCLQGEPGGFGTNGPVDFVSPDGVMFSRTRITGANLPPGEDIDGSMVLTVDVTSVEGSFIIDTTCTNIANHLYVAYGTLGGEGVVPEFTPGIITIQAPPNQPPVAICVQDPVVGIGAGCEATVVANTLDGGSFDPDGTIQGYRLNPEGPYGLGLHFLWLVVDDNAGGSDSCGLVLSVIDDTPPVISCPLDTTLTFNDNSCGAVLDFVALATDECGGVTISSTPPSGSFFPVGTTEVTCIATDNAGNKDTCWFMVTVVDGSAPWLVCNLEDAGPGSLRYAIQTANGTVGPDVIEFAVDGIIQPLSPLPPLSDLSGGITIDGFSAPGATLAPHVVSVVLDGSMAGSGSGLTIESDENVIKGLEIRNFPNDGVTVTGTPARFNTISSNLFHDNGGLAIDLGDDGVTVNDPGDGDPGPNDLLNFPTIDTIFMLGEHSFYLAGLASSPGDVVELYLAEKYLGVDTTGDPSGYGEGWRFFGSQVSDPVTGYYLFSPVVTDKWSSVTLTETDASGNTSEFSENRVIIPDSLIVTAYSPVTIIVITPDGADSVGIDFNTLGPIASYDDQTDYGLGPSGTPGELDDRVVITNIQPGPYRIKVRNDGTAGEDDNYFLGIRVDGSNEEYASANSSMLVGAPIANPVPPPLVEDEVVVAPHADVRGDLDGDLDITPIDLNLQIDILFFAAPLPNPSGLADLNCDGFLDPLDLNYMIDYLFFAGPAPCF